MILIKIGDLIIAAFIGLLWNFKYGFESRIVLPVTHDHLLTSRAINELIHRFLDKHSFLHKVLRSQLALIYCISSFYSSEGLFILRGWYRNQFKWIVATFCWNVRLFLRNKRFLALLSCRCLTTTTTTLLACLTLLVVTALFPWCNNVKSARHQFLNRGLYMSKTLALVYFFIELIIWKGLNVP
jgi:hypothetical protein